MLGLLGRTYERRLQVYESMKEKEANCWWRVHGRYEEEIWLRSTMNPLRQINDEDLIKKWSDGCWALLLCCTCQWVFLHWFATITNWGKQIVVGNILRSRRYPSTQNFDLSTIFSSKVIKVNYVEAKEWKLQLVIVVTIHSKLILRHEDNRWKVVSKMNAFKESYLRVVH